MRIQAFAASVIYRAPRHLGAFFCVLALLSLGACEKKSQTPDWLASGSSSEKAEERTLTHEKSPPSEHSQAQGIVSRSKAEKSSGELRFITYNVENWLMMDRYVNRKNLKDLPKPESEKQAVIRILARHQPDVIGLCEIGETADLTEIQEDLKAAGFSFPYSHHTGGVDPTRHLGILSRFPITSTAKPTKLNYQLAGQTYGINRGILDVTVQANGKFYRFLGIHLKSKRESHQGDQEVIRLNEGKLLRRHIDSIFATQSDARLIVYGDFNDTRSSPTIKAITGSYNDPSYLTAIPAKDSHGESWTYFWEAHDIYSRIDYVMISRAMRKDTDFKMSKILDDEDWSKASDHRPILAIFQ